MFKVNDFGVQHLSIQIVSENEQKNIMQVSK